MTEPISLDHLFPDRHSGESLALQLTRSFRAAIAGGILPASSRLLPSRELAKRLGVARNTITRVYEQLASEGYLEARIGSGTFIASDATPQYTLHIPSARSIPEPARRLARMVTGLDEIASTAGPLRIGSPDITQFPTRVWRRLALRFEFTSAEHLGYGQSSGLVSLREAISRHVTLFRGLAVNPEQVIVVEGAQSAFHLIALALADAGSTLAIEDPCYPLARAAFQSRGLDLRAVLVDEDGLVPEQLPSKATLCYVTPSHQFPLGGALPLSRRIALLAWARASDAYIIEDDYDGEFNAHPLPALASLDRDERVIYVGTFSKTLAPGLRLGYVVVPTHLIKTFQLARSISALGASLQQQEVLAEFMRNGYLVRHIRRLLAIYQRRRQALVDTLAQELPAGFAIGPTQTGLHVTVRGSSDFDDVRSAFSARDGQRWLPLSRLCLNRRDCNGFVLGFGAGPDDAIRPAAKGLAMSLRDSFLS